MTSINDLLLHEDIGDHVLVDAVGGRLLIGTHTVPQRVDVPSCERPWSIITPVESTNLMLNPSAEATGNYAAVGGAFAARATTYSKYGLYSFAVQTAANGEGISFTTATLSNAVHYVSAYVAGSLPAAWLWSIGGENHSPQLLEQIDATWALYGVQFSAAACNGATALVISQSGAGDGDFYLDGLQVEALTYPTTYIDGDQEGCSWNGGEHAASSTRSGQAKSGGRVRDLWETYGFFVEEEVGGGAAPQNLSSHDYALLPGGQLSGAKTESRNFTLVGKFIADTEEDLHTNRQALIKALAVETYASQQPTRLRYGGAEVHKQIDAYYAGGLEAQLRTSYGPWQPEGDDTWRLMSRWQERSALQFFAPDPMWYEIGNSSDVLDTNDSATFRYVGGRLRSTGQWDNLGPPNAAGTYSAVYDITEDETYIYFGGNFTNFDNIANADYIVRWNKQTETYSALGTGMNGIVYSLIIGSDGTLYAGGDFTTAGGGGANRIASWNGVAWSALGVGLNSGVRALTFGLDGTLYVGGNFTTAGGGAATYIAQWDGAAWAAVGAGLNNPVWELTTGIEGTIYAGGQFDDINGGPGGTYDYIIAWDGSSYSALSSGMNSDVFAVAVDRAGILYAGGDFTTAGGETVNYVASWNGTAWSALGSGLDNVTNGVNDISIGADNMVYLAGDFTDAGALDAQWLVRWNGSAYAYVDIDYGGNWAIWASPYMDPVITKYDLFAGYNASSTLYYAGLITADNEGSQPAYPVIQILRSGGTTATLKTIRNETTGLELLFDYDLLDGEQLTIDLTPTNKSITSSFFGARPDAILANSDFGFWSLLPGDNDVTAFVDVAGAPTITAWMEWQETYKSFD